MTVIVPHYSDLSSGFTVLWFVAGDRLSAVCVILSDTKLSAMSSNSARPTRLQMSYLPHKTIVMGLFYGFPHQLQLTQIM